MALPSPILHSPSRFQTSSGGFSTSASRSARLFPHLFFISLSLFLPANQTGRASNSAARLFGSSWGSTPNVDPHSLTARLTQIHRHISSTSPPLFHLLPPPPIPPNITYFLPLFAFCSLRRHILDQQRTRAWSRTQPDPNLRDICIDCGPTSSIETCIARHGPGIAQRAALFPTAFLACVARFICSHS